MKTYHKTCHSSCKYNQNSCVFWFARYESTNQNVTWCTALPKHHLVHVCKLTSRIRLLLNLDHCVKISNKNFQVPIYGIKGELRLMLTLTGRRRWRIVVATVALWSITFVRPIEEATVTASGTCYNCIPVDKLTAWYSKATRTNRPNVKFETNTRWSYASHMKRTEQSSFIFHTGCQK